MTDQFTKEKRSEIMSRIRSKNSKAELLVFAYLRKQGVYFQKHYSKIIGNPDLALPRKKKAIFIDGDFWHGRSFEKLLKSRGHNDYWTTKIKRNMERDQEFRTILTESGWKIMVVWESDINRKRTQSDTLLRIREFLTNAD